MISVVINVASKILLMDRYAQVGLAFATSIGVWVNFALLVWFAMRRDLIGLDRRLRTSGAKLCWPVSGSARCCSSLPAR